MSQWPTVAIAGHVPESTRCLRPFDVYDAERGDGDEVAGFAYPRVLPSPLRAEVERRLEAPITPVPSLIGAWAERHKRLVEAEGAEVMADGRAGRHSF